MAKECISGKMVRAITASGIMEIYRATAITHGPTEGVFKETGTKIKCMVAESITGKMVVLTKANTSWVKNKDLVSTSGLTVEFMRAIGLMVSNTAMENLHSKMEQ